MTGGLDDPAAGPALRQALEISGRHEFPVTARSLRAKEHVKAERSAWGLLLGGPAFLLFLFPIYAFFNGDFALALGAGPWLIGLALALWIVAWWLKRRAGRDYADPRIEVEVAEGNVAFRAPGRLERMSLSEAAGAITEVKRRGDYFDGLAIASPIGAISLDNAGFKWGRTAAAALYGRCVATGVVAAPTGKPTP